VFCRKENYTEMNDKHISIIAVELGKKVSQVTAAAALLKEEATVPFIARYRKEATGSLDEVEITAIRDRLGQLEELDKRRDAVLKSLEERGILADELKKKVEGASSMTELEDIYLPFRPKRRTRATAAKEKGLEPLAARIFEQKEGDPEAGALAFVDPEKGVESVDAALGGARDIIAEWVSEDRRAREKMRELYLNKGLMKSRVIPGKEEEGIKYRDYYDWEEPLSSAPSHRVLAIRRGEKEGFLSLRIMPPEEEAGALLEGLFIKGNGASSQQVRMALQDGYKRLLSSSIEAEIRLAAKKKADEAAIRVFAGNLRQLLLAPPLGGKNVLAIDPGFRTGCKVVCLDRQGKLLVHDTVYPHFSDKGTAEAAVKIRGLCAQFGVEAIAIGNGTAGRETEAFIRGLDLPKEIAVVMVNESGASIYSASEAAREEFPDKDLTVRGSVSIGRRLMDPLAELVKIDAKSIGVGQYQHDVDQPSLKRSLDDVVMSCVNGVGVEVNTASRELLTYVSGLGPQLAKKIIEFRNENGPFRSRDELGEVPRLGPKAFEQAAGFLRIRDGENPLDRSAVHPESYHIVHAMARDMECSVADLMGDDSLRKRVDLSRYVTDTVGMPTLTDIMAELSRPGRDPREQFEPFRFAEGIEKIEDVKKGMRLPGIVTNITAFGVFIDIGVHQDGLVHISELSDRYVKDPAEIVKVHQKVMVTVLDLDLVRKRIALSMKSGQTRAEAPAGREERHAKGRDIVQREKKEKRPEKFANSPFYDAFKKK
jgi:protein Tex